MRPDSSRLFILIAIMMGLLKPGDAYASACIGSDRLFPLANPGSWSATATSSLDANQTGAKIIDNNQATNWHSGPALYDSVTVDMGVQRTIAGLQYYITANNINARFANYEVYTSTDGNNFTLVPNSAGLLASGNNDRPAQTIAFDSEVTARYYRLKSTSGRSYVGGAELMPLVCAETGEFVPQFIPGTCETFKMATASKTTATTYDQYHFGHNWHLAKITTGTTDSDTATTANSVEAWQKSVVIGDPVGVWTSNPSSLAAEWIGSSRDGWHEGNVDYLYRLDFEFLGDATADSAYNQVLYAQQQTVTLNLFSDNAIYNVLLNGSQLTPSSGSYSSAYGNDGFTADGKDVEFLLDWSKVVGGNNSLIVHQRSGYSHDGFMAALGISGSCGTATYDFGDAPDSYGTTAYESGAAHAVSANLYLGGSVAGDDDGMPGGSDSSDNGVSFNASGGGGSITAVVTGSNDTGSDAMLCGYLDGAADGSVNSVFTRNILYLNQVGSGGGHEAVPGNEELCVQVPGTTSTNSITIASIGGFNGADASCTTAADKSFSCNLNFYPDYSVAVTTYARFRLTTDSEFFSNNSPSPTGLAADGEVEDYQLTYDPTSVTIDYIAIESAPVDDFLASFDNDGLDALLHSYSPGSRGWTGGADRQEQLEILNGLLDPDNDGEVAIVKWSTFDELGTVGFHLDRNGAGLNNWIGVTRELLPALGDAPLGGEYLYADPGALPGVDYLYKLTEQEAWGSMREYGPYLLNY